MIEWADRYPVVASFYERDAGFAKRLNQARNNGLPEELIPYYMYVYEECGLYGVATLMLEKKVDAWHEYLDGCCREIARIHVEDGNPRAKELGLAINSTEKIVRELCDKLRWGIVKTPRNVWMILDIDGSEIVTVNRHMPLAKFTVWDQFYKALRALT